MYVTTSGLIDVLKKSLSENGDLPICIMEDSGDSMLLLGTESTPTVFVEEEGPGHCAESLPKRLVIQ